MLSKTITYHSLPKAQVKGDKFLRVLRNDVVYTLDLLLVLCHRQHDEVTIKATHIMRKHADWSLFPFQVAAGREKVDG